MTNTKKFYFKKIICTLTICFSIMLSAFTGLNFSSIQVSADSPSNYKYEDVSKSLLGSTGYNFNVSTGTSPVHPSGWTEISDKTINTDNIKKGVVNLKDNGSFSSSNSKTSRPTMPKDEDKDESYFKNLMINSFNGPDSFGYKSNTIKLDADSYYEISVTLYTHRTEKTEDTEKTDPNASIYLTGLTDEDSELVNSTKFESINTLQAWTDYTFFVSTDESKSINIELWLGSKKSSVQGAVFFNKVQITRYSEDYYLDKTSTLNDTDEDQFNLINLSKPTTSPVLNSSFENISPTNWDQISRSSELASDSDSTWRIIKVSTFSKLNDNTEIATPGSNCSPNNESALFLYNKVDGYQGLESSKFVVDKHSYYKLTFWAKSDCNTGKGATVKLIDKTENNPADSVSLSLATTVKADSNTFRNDWSKYSFYIYGDAHLNKEISIQIWMGTPDTKTSGYVFIDDFRLEEINYSDFSSGSTQTNCVAFNMNNASDKFTIANSNFDRTQNEDIDNIYPLTPADWTKSSDSNTNNATLSGIVSTLDADFVFETENPNNPSEKIAYNPSPSNPNKLNNQENNNVLMIGSTAETNKQHYLSNEFTLNANSYYRISFYVSTDYVNNLTDDIDAGASFAVISGARTLVSYKNIKFNDNDWHKFEVYIKTGTTSESAKIQLTFEKLKGYVFFDDIILETSNETVYNDHIVLSEVNYVKVDLSKENFDNRTFNSKLNVQLPNNWTGTESNEKEMGKNTGIVSMEHPQLSDYSDTLSGNKNVLFINSPLDVYYNYTSKTKTNFTASKYYKISVNILTNLIKPTEVPENYGATFGLQDSKDIFISGIDTKGEWQNYTIYLYLEKDLSSSISLALGNTEQVACGDVLFDDLQISEIEESVFKDEVLEKDNNFFKGFINYTETDNSGEEHDHDEWNNEFNWVIIPSLLTGLAIIIAIIGFYAKKIKITRKPKVKTKYDRRKTLDKDIDKREKIALRQQIINELNEELRAIDREIEECNRLAEEQLQAIKDRLREEQDNIKKQKLEIEIRKKEATANREKQLKENPELITNTKAEKEFTNFIAKLDKQEMSLQKQLTNKEHKLNSTIDVERKNKLARILERQEYIRNEIAKIEAEIEEIARQEEEMWEEYRRAKADAKRRKTEYKAQIRQAKEEEKAKKLASKQNSTKATESTEKIEEEKVEEKEIKKEDKKSTTSKSKSATKKEEK